MAKKKPAAGSADIQFEVPDDVFGPDGEVDSDSEPVSLADDEPDQQVEDKEEPTKKEKPPKVAAKPEEDEEEPDLPPSEAPSDPAYLLAEERARRAELEQRLAAIEAGAQKKPVDEEAEADRDFAERRKAARDRHIKAVREDDVIAMQEVKWQLEDLDREEFRRDSAKTLRDGRRDREPERGPDPRAISQQRSNEIQAEMFRAKFKVTPEENRKMEAEWQKLVAREPAWASVPWSWSKFDKALKLVRKTSSGGAEANLVEGGQSAPTGKGRGVKRTTDQAAARAFGMSESDYREVLVPYRKRAGR